MKFVPTSLVYAVDLQSVSPLRVPDHIKFRLVPPRTRLKTVMIVTSALWQLACESWNDLPPTVVNAPFLPIFKKRHFKTYLFNHWTCSWPSPHRFLYGTICRRCYYRPPAKRRAVWFWWCLYVCQTITSESLDVGSLYLHMRYISTDYGSSSYTEVIGSRSRSQEQKR